MDWYPAVSDDHSALTVYISYQYLAAQQLGTLLLELHGLFDELLYADTPEFRQLPSAPAARLRVESVVTGNSITISVVQGVTQMVGSADPTMVGVASGLATLSAAGMLLLRMLHRAEDLRAKWLRDSRENDRQRLELAGKKIDLLGKELQLSAHVAEAARNRQAIFADTVQVLAEQAPNRQPTQQEILAERLVPHLDAIAQVAYDENINTMRVTVPKQNSRPGEMGP
jgi:hypothetical protein